MYGVVLHFIAHQMTIMVLRLLLIVICTCWFTLLQGQSVSPQVIASAGSLSGADDIILEWTLGEMAIETIYATDGMFTEGFHQPVLLVEKQSTTQVWHPDFYSKMEVEIDVMPNPASSVLNIQVRSNSSERIVALLMDATGKSITSRNIDPLITNVQLDIHSLPAGMYVLRFTDEEGRLIEIFKVSKVQ